MKKRLKFQIIIVYLNSECCFKNRTRRPCSHQSSQLLFKQQCRTVWAVSQRWRMTPVHMQMRAQKTKNILFGIVLLRPIEWYSGPETQNTLLATAIVAGRKFASRFFCTLSDQSALLCWVANQNRNADDSHKITIHNCLISASNELRVSDVLPISVIRWRLFSVKL